MSRRSSPKYGPILLAPSCPALPTQPSLNNIEKWHQSKAAHEEEGLDLLIDHYSIPQAASPLEKMRALALELARDHVPFFSSKRPKTSKWNIHEHAKFLLNVQSELKKHKKLGAAVINAGRRLPLHLRIHDEKSLKKRYSLARNELSKLVSVNLEGALEPLGEFQGNLFKSFLQDDYYDLGAVRFDPCPDDPYAVIVSGLSTEDPSP
jgi:hypothetical protein